MEDSKNNFNTNSAVLTIFSIACAIFYGVNALKRLSVFTQALFQGYLFVPGWIFTAVFAVLYIVLNVWMCLILVCIAKKRTPENSDGLLLCLGGGGVCLVVEQLLQDFYLLYRYRGFARYLGMLFTTVLGVIIAVGGVYVILRFVMGENPIIGKNNEELLTAMKSTSFGLEKSVSGIGKQFDTDMKDGQNQNNQTVFYTQAPFRLKTDRSLLVYILLSIVTCGLYGLYFIYALARDINIACDGDGRSTAGLIKLILLSLITCGIYDWIWYYSLGNRLASNAPRYGMNFQENGTAILLWRLCGLVLCGIGPIIAMNIIIKNTNMLCGAYNHQHYM